MQIVGVTGFGRFAGTRVDVANFFLGQSVGIDETKTFSKNLFFPARS